MQLNAAKAKVLADPAAVGTKGSWTNPKSGHSGTIDITTVLNTQRTLFSAQDQLVIVRLTRLQTIVSLFQALGGGWVLPEELASHRGRARRAAR